MATLSYTTSAKEDAIIAAGASKAGLANGPFVQQIMRNAIEALRLTLKHDSEEAARAEFEAALAAGRPVLVTFNANTGQYTTTRQ